MTLASRNRFIRIALICSIGLVFLTVAGTVLVLAHHSLPDAFPGFRPLPSIEAFPLMKWSPLATSLAIIAFPLFSAIGLAYILFAFEKTQTVEITFFATCIFSVSLEAFRIFVPLYGLWIHAGFYAVAIARITYFSRFFTLLLLFASTIFATGQSVQQHAASIFLIAFCSFGISNAIPVDTGVMSSTFLMKSGYDGMIDLFFLTIGLMSFVSCLIVGLTRSAREYTQSAFGILLFLAGYAILVRTDTWLVLASGAVVMFGGAWLYLDRMHRYYLWQ
jgi:hypothetical protein